ncbi:MAG: penicillin-binding protein 1C [Treponema sp.]|nr:penicillin-binding protein 1C [Treponema sp.]
MRRIELRILIASVVVLVLMFAVSLNDPLFNVSYSPVLYDREGRLLGAQVASDGQWRFPGTGELNKKFSAAMVEAEDSRFWIHPGVDPAAIGRALISNIRNGRVVSGGSTITMQCIRLSRGVTKRTVLEKCVEALLALRLELGKSKQDILALYAANAPFGANVVGLEAAAWRWFGRGPEDLSWAEAATLAVLPNNPALIHPGRNRDALKTNRDTLLTKLFNKGYFDQETLNLSLAESLPGEPLPLPQFAPHLLDRLVLESKKVTKSKTMKAAVTGGPAADTAHAFYTTIDKDIQERVQAILNRNSARFAENGIYNGACLIINTMTGETAAYVGNTNTANAGNVDIINSVRSSGSLLKPFLYAAMLDSGDILPSSLVSDIPTRVGSYSPENITRTYLGAVPADEALARSLNVPAVRSLRVFGVDRFGRLLRALGLTTLVRANEDYGLPLILGGAEVSLWEMTGLYAGLGRSVNARDVNNPVFFPPAVLDKTAQAPMSGNRALAATGTSAGNGTSQAAAVNGSPLISPGAAWITLEALVSGVRPGEEAIWQDYANSRHIAWKTGTSFGYRDAWAIGVTPEWTVGVWIGNASGEGRAELRSAVTAAPVMFELFSALNSAGGSSQTWFAQPASQLRRIEVCAASGFPAGPDCANVKFADVPVNSAAANVCPYCRTIIVDQSLKHRVTLQSGSSAAAVQVKWFVLPPAEEWYYRRWNLDYKPLPPEENPAAADGDTVIALYNPEPNGQVLVPREIDGSEGRIVFSAALRDDNGTLYWHLDGNYLGSTKTFHEMEARPQPGPHTLTLIDGAGNTLTRRFTVLDKNGAG